MGDERCAAYVLDSGCTRAVLATDVQLALDAGDSSARNRQFRCPDGRQLIHVRTSCTGAVAHFRHKPPGAPSGPAGAPDGAACGCSNTHIEAQALIQKHISRLCVKTWRACRKHPAREWRAGDGAEVSLEEPAVFNGRRVRYDCVVREAGRLQVIEVRPAL